MSYFSKSKMMKVCQLLASFGCCSSVLLLFLLLVDSIKGSVQVHHQSVENEYFFELPLDKFEQLTVPKDQKLIVRLPSNSLLKYTSYKDVSILHFRVPPDTRTAFFTFKAFEESKSAFQRKCKLRDVTLHLKASSYPVISPENITFPKNFLSSDQRFKVYNLQFQSNEEEQRIAVQGPFVGNWFAVAFVSWTDPNNDRIEQQGLAASCDTLLLAEMSVTRFQPIIINNGQVHSGNLTSSIAVQQQHNANASKTNADPTPDDDIRTSRAVPPKRQQHHHAVPQPQETQSLSGVVSVKARDAAQTQTQTLGSADSVRRLENGHEDGNHSDSDSDSDSSNNSNNNSSKSTTNNEIIYKFYVPADIGVATARILFAEVCVHCPDVGFHVQANAYPSPGSCSDNEHNYIHSTVIKPNQTGEISIEFYVQPSTWHYALLKFVSAADEIWEANKLAAAGASSGWWQSRQGQQRLRRQNYHNANANANANGRKSTALASGNVSYALQIDFQEPTNESGNVQRPKPSNGTVTANAWQPVRFRDMEFYALLRQTYREFFLFDYDLEPDINGTVPGLLNLTAGTPAGFAFELGEVYDIGGTLTFAVSMKHALHFNSELKGPPPTLSPPGERGGILAEKLVANPDVGTGKELLRSNQTIIVCMHLNEPGVPTWPDKCRYGQWLFPASSIVNNTGLETGMGLVHVPFPESGRWYVTMGLYCHGAETARVTIIDSVKEFVHQHVRLLRDMHAPCACAGSAARYESCIGTRSCLAAMNETETLKVKECMMDYKCTPDYAQMTRRFEIHHKAATEQHFALDNCNSSVMFSISSSPCVAGRCGRFGRCYHYMSGGFVFSTCVCMKGYRGWDCTEDSQVPSSMSILLASLLLTLSNLLFFPSIYMALRRRYYTEAVIYFFAMFFSIFYHACDSGEDEYSFCLVKIGVLQFCDFYCGLLAIWVTLVAMAHIRPQFVSLLHMLGAIMLAFGTELNKQSLWVFLAPALTGICLISTSWGLRCAKTRKWFPARRYLTVFMPLGMVLVMVGLVCYAFLQTKQNYHIVHSVWHMVMALSILCLLPSRKSFMPKC